MSNNVSTVSNDIAPACALPPRMFALLRLAKFLLLWSNWREEAGTNCASHTLFEEATMGTSGMREGITIWTEA